LKIPNQRKNPSQTDKRELCTGVVDVVIRKKKGDNY